jgi:tRNA threonylcarbamoyladenosine biosynthesis protein TsaB
MSTMLAIETSAELASVALLHEGVLTSDQASGAVTHSQIILPMAQRLLATAGVSLSQCDAVAFGAGPGSFTGVRTACGITQGLAFGARLPVVPVGTLLAMAQRCREHTRAENVLSVLDARMGEVYWAQYRFVSDEWQIVMPPMLSSADAVAPVGAVHVCGNGLRAYEQAFSQHDWTRCDMDDLVPHAAQVARLAAHALARDGGVPARDAEPIYLRNKVALTTIERLEKAAREAA